MKNKFILFLPVTLTVGCGICGFACSEVWGLLVWS